MSRLSNLLRQVETLDPQLAANLKLEIDALSGRRAFGLNFEHHIPETVELPGRPVRRGDKVRFLPERGEKPSSVDRRLWRVGRIRRADEGRVADLIRQDPEAEHQTVSRAVDNLVVAAEFRDPIYPGLVSTGKVERGGDKPFHTVINAENFHALQVLLYTHEGKVDAIYIGASGRPRGGSGRDRRGDSAVSEHRTATEFIRRMLLHVLPSGFHRIRYYGFLANRNREQKLAECRRLLHAPPLPSAEHAGSATIDYRERYEALTGRSLRQCPRCDDGNMLVVDCLAGQWVSPAILDSS